MCLFVKRKDINSSHYQCVYNYAEASKMLGKCRRILIKIYWLLSKSERHHCNVDETVHALVRGIIEKENKTKTIMISAILKHDVLPQST